MYRFNYKEFIDENFEELTRLLNDSEYSDCATFGQIVYYLYDTPSQSEMEQEGIVYEVDLSDTIG